MWALVALIVSALVTDGVTRSVVIEMETFDVEFNRDIMENITVSLITVDKRNVFNGSLIPRIDITSFDLTITATPKNRKVAYFNVTLEGCEFITPPPLSPISLSGSVINNIRNSIKNAPKNCPIKKFTEVLVSNLYMDTELMPFVLIQTRFELSIIATIQSNTAFRMIAGGVIGPKRKRVG